MILFLTSSPALGYGKDFNPENGFTEKLREETGDTARGLFVASDPDNAEFTDVFASDIRKCFEHIGVDFTDYEVLDGRNAEKTAELVNNADLIILSGGHVPTQNAFFRKIGLRDCLENFEGVIMGISAGSMNSAETVYAQPELEGESIDPEYEKFLPGLGLTLKQIIPHYNLTKDNVLDGRKLFEDITYRDSIRQEFYVFPDGTYLFSKNGHEHIYGPAWIIKNGFMAEL